MLSDVASGKSTESLESSDERIHLALFGGMPQVKSHNFELPNI